MHHGAGRKAFEQFAHPRRIGDISANKGIARVIRHWCERVEIARIGEFVDYQHLMRRLADDVTHHGGADKARAAGDQDAFGHQRPSSLKGETKSAKRPSLRSFSDRTTSLCATGHSIASVGSFQIRPLSLAGT